MDGVQPVIFRKTNPFPTKKFQKYFMKLKYFGCAAVRGIGLGLRHNRLTEEKHKHETLKFSSEFLRIQQQDFL